MTKDLSFEVFSKLFGKDSSTPLRSAQNDRLCEDKFLRYKINPGANPAAKIVLFLSGISINIKML